MKNISYIILGLVAGYFLFKKKRKKYSITQSIETLSEDQYKKIGELPDQF